MPLCATISKPSRGGSVAAVYPLTNCLPIRNRQMKCANPQGTGFGFDLFDKV
nr:MAG TPA: hypothetical protein [Caudoviricetes sp.]